LHADSSKTLSEKGSGSFRQTTQTLWPDESGLTAMEAQPNTVPWTSLTVLGYTKQYGFEYFIAHKDWASFEASIRVLIHVAVAAVQIAEFRYLQH
jgi:hypothetical protein